MTLEMVSLNACKLTYVSLIGRDAFTYVFVIHLCKIRHRFLKINERQFCNDYIALMNEIIVNCSDEK